MTLRVRLGADRAWDQSGCCLSTYSKSPSLPSIILWHCLAFCAKDFNNTDYLVGLGNSRLVNFRTCDIEKRTAAIFELFYGVVSHTVIRMSQIGLSVFTFTRDVLYLVKSHQKMYQDVMCNPCAFNRAEPMTDINAAYWAGSRRNYLSVLLANFHWLAILKEHLFFLACP